MARRGDIAALGVLAALGAGILENKRNKDKVPVESLESQLESKPKAKSSYDEEHVFTGPMEAKKKSAPTKTQASAKAESKPSTQGYTRGKEQLSDYQMRQARDLEKGKTRGRPAEGAPRTTTVTPARAEAPSGDLASQIPGSSPEGWQGGSGERVTGNEFTRNVSNTAIPLAAAAGAGALGPAVRSASNIGMYGRGSQAAGQIENAAARQLANNPTRQLTGPSKSDLVARDRAARAAAREREMLEENAARSGLNPESPGYEGAARAVRESLGDGNWVLRKKGGSVKSSTSSKPAAKGWGKARGARQAKYY